MAGYVGIGGTPNVERFVAWVVCGKFGQVVEQAVLGRSFWTAEFVGEQPDMRESIVGPSVERIAKGMIAGSVRMFGKRSVVREPMVGQLVE